MSLIILAGCQVQDTSTDPDRPAMKLYTDLDDPEGRAEAYREADMPWPFATSADVDTVDAAGVPLTRYDFGTFYNPVTISQKAMAAYNTWIETEHADHRAGFLRHADWLVQNRDAQHYYRYAFPWRHLAKLELDGEETYTIAAYMEPGWVSAMAQGMALGVLARAYHATGEAPYLEAAEGVFSTLRSSTDSLWVVTMDTDGYYWLEEYPNEHNCHVLNGMLFGLWGLWDFYVATEDERALTLFKAGLRSVADNYPMWNIPDEDASLYCLHYMRYASYHAKHIEQLNAYAEAFEIEAFREAVKLFTDG